MDAAQHLWFVAVVVPQALDHALLGAAEEGLDSVGDVQGLQLGQVDVTLEVVPGGRGHRGNS